MKVVHFQTAQYPFQVDTQKANGLGRGNITWDRISFAGQAEKDEDSMGVTGSG